jgi:hypothetical protein
MGSNPYDVAVVNPLQALMIGQQSYDASQKVAQQTSLRDLIQGQTANGKPVDWQKVATAQAGSGDLNGAVQSATLAKAFSPETSPDLQAYNYATKNNGYTGTFLDFKKDIAQAGSTKISTTNNVSTGGGGSDKQIFDSVDESAKLARAAATGLTGLREARNALNSGIISGAGANQVLGLQKIAAAFGAVDPSSIQNTETFRAAIAPQVAATLKATVGTANISNSDREFAEKAAGGNITLDSGSIARLLNIMERAGTAVVDTHNKRLDDIYPNDPKFKRERALFRVNALSPSQPQQGQQQTSQMPKQPTPSVSDIDAEIKRRGL